MPLLYYQTGLFLWSLGADVLWVEYAYNRAAFQSMPDSEQKNWFNARAYLFGRKLDSERPRSFLWATGSGQVHTARADQERPGESSTRGQHQEKKLRLQPGDSLSVEQKDQSIVLTRAHNIPRVGSPISKDTFKRIIFLELANGPKTWSELRQRTHLPFRRPPPFWVRELQIRHGVEIVYDAKEHRMLWNIRTPSKLIDHEVRNAVYDLPAGLDQKVVSARWVARAPHLK
jgi:hypothetical protein